MTKEQALKLKPGDKVIANKDSEFGYYLKGKIYIFDSLHFDSSEVYIYTTFSEKTLGGLAWKIENFDLAYPKIFNKKLEELISD